MIDGVTVRLLSSSERPFWNGSRDVQIPAGYVGVQILVPSERSPSGFAYVAFLVEHPDHITDTHIDASALSLAAFNLETARRDEYRDAIKAEMIVALREVQRAA